MKFVWFFFVALPLFFSLPLFESQASFFWAAFHRSACLFYLAGCGSGSTQCGRSPMEDEPKQIPKVSPTPPGLGRTVQPTKSRGAGGGRARGHAHAGTLFGFRRKNR